MEPEALLDLVDTVRVAVDDRLPGRDASTVAARS